LIRLDVIVAGISISLIDILRFEWSRKGEKKMKSALPGWGLIYFLIIWLGVTIVFRLFGGGDWTIWGVYYAPAAAIIFGIRRSQRSLDNDIWTVEALP
jgi:hypothetical protein